jgi:hypothetical protein
LPLIVNFGRPWEYENYSLNKSCISAYQSTLLLSSEYIIAHIRS